MSRIFVPTLLLAAALAFAVASVQAQPTLAEQARAKTEEAEKKKQEALERVADAKAEAEKVAAEAEKKAAEAKAEVEKKAAEAKAEAAKEKAKTAAEAAKPNLHPRATIETTLGDIVVELDAEKAPHSTLNFIQYARDGYYNGTIFHRVIKDFMVQGGGYTPDMEQKTAGLRPGIPNEWRNGLKNVRGTLAMARLGGDPDSATAQFFFNVVDNAFLDRPQGDGAAYAVFGKVVDGMDVVDAIRNTRVIRHAKYPSDQPVTPATPVIIKSVKLPETYDPSIIQAQLDQAKTKVEDAKETVVNQAIAKIEQETGNKFRKTDSGLMICHIQEGDGPSPNPTDRVRVHYRGTFLDGKEFDSSYKRGTPIVFPLNGVIRGWTEGVGLMKTGGSAYLVIPPDLGYGARATGPIPPNSILVFKIELLGIEPAE